MPLIDVTYGAGVGEEVLRRLAELLPDVVIEAVECPEEPVTGPPQPGLPTVVGFDDADGAGEGRAEPGETGAAGGDEPNRWIPTATPETAAAAAVPSRTRRVIVLSRATRWAGVT